jgi:hypothetical protein
VEGKRVAGAFWIEYSRDWLRIRGRSYPVTRFFGRGGYLLPMLVVTCLLAGCGSSSQKAQASKSDSLDQLSQSYVRLAVALGERDPDSIDYYFGPADWVADIHRDPPTLATIRLSSLELIKELNAVPFTSSENEERRHFLISQLQAIAGRVDVLSGEKLTFDQETQLLFGVVVPPQYNERPLARIRMELNRLLPGEGNLAERYLAFDGKFTVPPQRLPAVMGRAIQGCRQRTLAHLQLPRGERVTVEYVHNKPWSGFSKYEGNFHSLVEINTDFSLTVDQALQLACHETYPGHHAYNSLRDLQFARAQHRSEFMVQTTFSPQSLLSEAAATFAPEVAFPWPDRMRFERDELFPLAGIDKERAPLYAHVERLVDALHVAEPYIARDYLDGKLEFVRAGSALETQVLMAQSDATLKYINEYRTYMTTYTFGRDLVAGAVDQPAARANAEDVHWQRFFGVMTRTAPLEPSDSISTAGGQLVATSEHPPGERL